jgi:hypothetical protein
MMSGGIGCGELGDGKFPNTKPGMRSSIMFETEGFQIPTLNLEAILSISEEEKGLKWE